MTLWGLLLAFGRRWPVVLVGAVCTASLGWVLLMDPGVYWTRTEVVFLAPASGSYPNAIRTTSEDLIITAGAVGRRIGGPAQVEKYASPDVTLVGLGVRRGWSVRLPDTGGQWATHFARQLLLVEVVDPDRASLERQRDALLARIQAELDTLQDGRGVDPVNRITLAEAPDTAVIHHVTGSRSRATAMTAALGLAATVAVVVLLEHRASVRPSSGRDGSGADAERATAETGSASSTSA